MPRTTLSRTGPLLLVLLLLPSCRTGRQFSSDDEHAMLTSSIPPRVERTRDILSFEEIRVTSAENAYDAVVRLRPEFLGRRPIEYDDLEPRRLGRAGTENTQSTRDDRYPTIFLNGTWQGGPASLRTIPVSAIIELRFYRESLVPATYGVNHPRGIIDVRTAR
jgi:hypothetical protein